LKSLVKEPPPSSPLGPLWREMLITRVFYISLKFLGKGTSLQVSYWGPTDRDAHHQVLLHISFRKPSKGPPPTRFPFQSPTESDAPSPKHAFTRLSKAQERHPLPGSPTGPPC
jgi:hypothetical protein